MHWKHGQTSALLPLLAKERIMGHHIVVFGYGAVGQAAVEVALKQGHSVTVAQRSTVALPAGVKFAACDVLDPHAVERTVAGASQIVVAIGFPYNGEVWNACWPRAMTNLISACAVHKARMIFVDNLYMYGPQSRPLSEDMPLTDFGVKPAVRSKVTRLWLAAVQAGRARITALRAPDFYGPMVRLSHIGDVGFGAVAKGNAATLVIPADTPHAFAYVPDIARAVGTLLEAPDDDYGQAWHVPCAPPVTPRRIIEFGAAAIGRTARVHSLPLWMLAPAGAFSGFLSEVAEMRFTFDRPYEVDSRKFGRRFWSDATAFEFGAPETARSFLNARGALAA
jgi:nucleoside-diphosphate-sugar epimerase